MYAMCTITCEAFLCAYYSVYILQDIIISCASLAHAYAVVSSEVMMYTRIKEHVAFCVVVMLDCSFYHWPMLTGLHGCWSPTTSGGT